MVDSGGISHVVTESNMFSPVTREKLERHMKRIFSALKDRLKDRGEIVDSFVELFMRIDEDDCSYYLVHSRIRRAFSLEDVAAFQTNSTTAHRHSVMFAEFLSHCEHFPLHFADCDGRAARSLIRVLKKRFKKFPQYQRRQNPQLAEIVDAAFKELIAFDIEVKLNPTKSLPWVLVASRLLPVAEAYIQLRFGDPRARAAS